MSFRDMILSIFRGIDRRPEPPIWIGDTEGPTSTFWGDSGETTEYYFDENNERVLIGDSNQLPAVPRGDSRLDSRVAFPADSFEDSYPAAGYTPAAYSTPGYQSGSYPPAGREEAAPTAAEEPWEIREQRVLLRAQAPMYYGAVDPKTGYLGYTTEDAEAWQEKWVDEQLAKRAEREASRGAQEEQEAAPTEAGEAVDAPKSWYQHGAITYQQLANQARFIGREDHAAVYDAYAEQFEKLHDEAEVAAAIEAAAAEAPANAGDDRDCELRLTLLVTDAAIANAAVENSAEKHEREAREYRAAAEALPRDSDTVDRMLEAAKQHEEEAQLFRMVEASATAAHEAADEATREDIPDDSHASPDTSRRSRESSRDDPSAGY